MKKSSLEKRNYLKRLCNNPQKGTFVATFQRFGRTTTSEMFPDKTLCLENLASLYNEKQIAQHIWVRYGQINNPDTLKNIHPGDKIEFIALPYNYIVEKRNKIVSEKYSLGDITITNINDTKVERMMS